MGWRDLALIIALAGVLAAIAALGIGVLSTWDVAAPSPPPKSIEAGRPQAAQGRTAPPPARE
jgi:hypothetical protein